MAIRKLVITPLTPLYFYSRSSHSVVYLLHFLIQLASLWPSTLCFWNKWHQSRRMFDARKYQRFYVNFILFIPCMVT